MRPRKSDSEPARETRCESSYCSNFVSVTSRSKLKPISEVKKRSKLKSLSEGKKRSKLKCQGNLSMNSHGGRGSRPVESNGCNTTTSTSTSPYEMEDTRKSSKALSEMQGLPFPTLMRAIEYFNNHPKMTVYFGDMCWKQRYEWLEYITPDGPEKKNLREWLSRHEEVPATPLTDPSV